jgi:hypothetical protein
MADQRVRSLLDQIEALKLENAQLEGKLAGPSVKWGILTSGKICNDFCIALSTLPQAKIHAVAARSIESASAFAARFDIPKAYGSYAELAADPEIDIIYIGSPHNYHKGHALLCIENGKHVLCEKPMTLNAADAKEVLAAARAKGLFFMQGIWSRFFPVSGTGCSYYIELHNNILNYTTIVHHIIPDSFLPLAALRTPPSFTIRFATLSLLELSARSGHLTQHLASTTPR